MTQEPLIDTDTLAAQFGRSKAWVELGIARGMPHIILFGERRFRLSEVEAWVHRNGRRKLGALRPSNRPVARSVGAASCEDLWMYAIESVAGGEIKLGITTDPRRRLVGLQTGNPTDLLLLAAWRIDSPEEEAHLHRRFGHLRIRGEWFAASSELRRVVMTLGGDYDDRREEGTDSRLGGES